MRVRQTVLSLSVLAVGYVGLVSACATAVELTEDDDTGKPGRLDAGDDASDDDGTGSSSGSSSPPRSSSGSGGVATSSGSPGSSGGGSSSGSSGGASLPPLGPAPGSACPPGSGLNDTYTQQCGLCGSQQATCIRKPGSDPPVLEVSQYSACSGEVAGGCVPGTQQDDASCGYCGTQSRTCGNQCQWISGACQNQVTGSEDVRCMPGATRLTNQLANGTCPSQTLTTWSCFPPDAGEQFRCRWDKPTSTSDCAAPPTFINASPTSGQEVDYMLFDFLQTQQKRASASGACTASTTLMGSGAATYWGGWVEVKNPTAAPLAVDLGSITTQDMMLYVYTTRPTNDDQLRQTCTRGNDYCSGGMTGADACLLDVTIPANGSIWVFSVRYSNSASLSVVEHPIRIKTR